MKSFKRYQLAYLALLNSGKYSIVFEVTFNVRQYLLFFIVPCFIINFFLNKIYFLFLVIDCKKTNSTIVYMIYKNTKEKEKHNRIKIRPQLFF